MAHVSDVQQWLNQFWNKVTENKEYLNKLDTAIGDGDHGSNLRRGAEGVTEKIEDSNYDTASALFKDVGMALLSKVGGASGPLYATAFLEMAKVADDSDDVSEWIEAGFEGVKKRGKSETGEKTMLDVWGPAAEALKNDSLSKEDIDYYVEETKDMKATKGRASYLGDRSIGHIDPGAQSSAYFFEALVESDVLSE